MLFFQNLVDETQMPKPQKYTDTFILTKKLFIVGLRGLQNISIPVERPCKMQAFCQRINMLKGNHCILRIQGAPVCQKVPKLYFQSQCSMSKTTDFLFFFQLRRSISETIFC